MQRDPGYVTQARDSTTDRPQPNEGTLVAGIIGTKPSSQLIQGRGGVWLAKAAFPDNAYSPPEVLERKNCTPVSLHVALELGGPEIDIAGRRRAPLASLVPMPETAMHENNSSARREDEVRTPGKLRRMQTVPEPGAMQGPAQEVLRLRVGASDTGHHARPGRGIDYIDQGCQPVISRLW